MSQRGSASREARGSARSGEPAGSPVRTCTGRSASTTRGSILRFFYRPTSAGRAPALSNPRLWSALPSPAASRSAAAIRDRVSTREESASPVDATVQRIDAFFVDGEDGSSREFRLTTHFQPIFSLAHRQPVGYEALIRGTDPSGRMYLPAELLAQAPAGVARMQLDRQCRALHVRNFQRLGAQDSWLFLNVDP